jgi:hypothetical protein
MVQVTTDLHTGKEKKKHKMGGAYPGNRRKPQAPYTPSASQFNPQGQATAHFVSYGGGNALVLQQGGLAQPQVGEKAQFIQGKEKMQCAACVCVCVVRQVRRPHIILLGGFI